MIPNPGVAVSLRAETNLKLACYQVRHCVRTSRDLAPTGVTLASMRSMEDLKTVEEKHVNPTVQPKIKGTNWPKTIEAIVEYLRSYNGTTGIPLAYIIRKESGIPFVDPIDGYANV